MIAPGMEGASLSEMSEEEIDDVGLESSDEEEAETLIEGEVPQRLLQQLELTGNELWSKALRHLPVTPKSLCRLGEDYSRFANLGSLRPQVFPFHPINRKLGLVFGDIAALLTDAVVCPASVPDSPRSELATHVALLAGPALAPELRRVGRGAKIGDACSTGAGALPCKKLIHAFCPLREDPDQLRSCIEQALYLLTLERLRTAAFPILSAETFPSSELFARPPISPSTGLPQPTVVSEGSRLPYYPLIPAIHVLLATIREWLEREENRFKVDLILIVAANERERRALLALMPEYFPRDAARESADEPEPQTTEEETRQPSRKKKKKAKKGKKGKKK